MGNRRFLGITTILLLITATWSAPDKLSPNQKAPLHARSSAGRSLAVPRAGGLTPANVGRLKPGGGAPPPKQQQLVPQEDGVQKEESSSFKEVNGETVRVVVGKYAYESPDGLPVSFKYMADENGNQASFSIGKATGGGGGGGGSRPSGGGRPGGGGAGGAGRGPGGAGPGGAGGGIKGGGGGIKGGGAAGGEKYLPPN